MEFKGRTSFETLCQWADVPRSSMYYRAHPGPRGKKASTQTLWKEQLVENSEVVEEIRRILAQPYCVYGYQMMTLELRAQGYLINKKKTYRLMDEHRLLSGKKIRCNGSREWVKYRRIQADRPMQYLCLDIKYIWVQGENRWYYQLAIIDVYSRRILSWIFQKNVRQNDVVQLMRLLDLRYGLKGVIIRNDNGSQFLAHKVRQTLKDLEARQEFTHVATPEENAYIEAFHSIQQRELIDRHEISSYYDAKRHIEAYMDWYNNHRRHGSLNGLTPKEQWARGWSCSTVRPPFAPAQGGLSRPADTFENSMKTQPLATSLDKPSAGAYLCLTGEQEEGRVVLNSFENFV